MLSGALWVSRNVRGSAECTNPILNENVEHQVETAVERPWGFFMVRSLLQ